MADLVEKVEQEVAEIDKHQAFLEQSEGLVKKAILAIENVGKVANSKKFDYSEDEVEKMFAAMEEALADTKHIFKKKKEFHW